MRQKVEHAYGFAIKRWKVIKKEKKSSIVVQIVTKTGEKYALKSLYLDTDRQQFIAMSEQLLAEKGVELARPVQTRKGELYMLHKKHPYVLYQWIDGAASQLRHKGDLNEIVRATAQFHRASYNLRYPSQVKLYGHPHWKKEYKERLKLMKKWYQANKSSRKKNEAIMSRSVPFFQRMAKKALKELKASAYEDYINRPAAERSLVHGDLHHNNILERKQVKVLIDFEDVRYDIPSKDLLRTYSMYTKHRSFQGNEFRSMMNTYEQHHALPNEVRQLVLIDMLYPHIFERLVRKKKYVGMDAKELKHRIKQEKKKASYIYRHYFAKAGTAHKGERS